MLKNQSLAAKIFSLGLVMTLIMVGIVSITIWQVRNAQEINDRVIALRAPTARTSVALLNGVNHSLAALRGWIILANPVFKQERADAWGEIEKNLAAMRDYSRNWTNPENVRRLKEIDGLFGDFRNYQKEIEDIANTPDNTPASKILIQEAAPKAAVLAAEITNMIDAEAPLPATAERKALFAMMADVRGTLGLSLGAIRAYLLSGDEKFQEEFEKLWEKNEIRFTDLSGNRQLLSPEQAMSFDTFSAARDEFKVLPPRMFEIRGSEKWNVANHLLRTKAAPTALRIKENLDAMAEDQKKLMDQDTILAHETNTRLIWLLVIIAIVAALAALALSLAITRSITAPLNRISEVLRDNSTQVASASGQISASSQSLAEASTEQASSLEETSASLEQMSSQTRANADNAQEANSLAATTRQEAESGSQTMKEMIGSMDAINKSSGEISKIIKVIEEIAFQTNLLALNAAVEAARAGEHGKGFAVVAEEVRNLAQRSATAAKDTSELIEEAVKRAEEGNTMALKSGKVLDGIMERVRKITDLVAEINSASNEQAQGVEQINQAVAQMDKATQQNAATAEEAAAASEELNAQADSMGTMVEDLVKLIKGSSADQENGFSGKRLSRPGNRQAKRLTSGQENDYEDF